MSFLVPIQCEWSKEEETGTSLNSDIFTCMCWAAKSQRKIYYAFKCIDFFVEENKFQGGKNFFGDFFKAFFARVTNVFFLSFWQTRSYHV